MVSIPDLPPDIQFLKSLNFSLAKFPTDSAALDAFSFTSLVTSVTFSFALLYRFSAPVFISSTLFATFSPIFAPNADIEAVIKIAVESMSRLLQVNVGCIYVGEQAEPVYI